GAVQVPTDPNSPESRPPRIRLVDGAQRSLHLRRHPRRHPVGRRLQAARERNCRRRRRESARQARRKEWRNAMNTRTKIFSIAAAALFAIAIGAPAMAQQHVLLDKAVKA